MKTIKLFAIALMALASSSAAFAQFVNNGTSSLGKSAATTDNYSRIYASFNVLNVDDLDDNFKGATIGIVWGSNITQNVQPIFFESGVEATWNTYEESGYDETTKINLLSFSVPMNLVYKVEVPNTNAILSPFVGLNLKYHAMGKAKWEDDYYNESESYDIFDKKDMYGDPFKRFQVGMNLGIGISINNLYIGYKFQPDFTPIMKDSYYNEKIKTRTHQISLGVNF